MGIPGALEVYTNHQPPIDHPTGVGLGVLCDVVDHHAPDHDLPWRRRGVFRDGSPPGKVMVWGVVINNMAENTLTNASRMDYRW